jgi:hypothetical protein
VLVRLGQEVQEVPRRLTAAVSSLSTATLRISTNASRGKASGVESDLDQAHVRRYAMDRDLVDFKVA